MRELKTRKLTGNGVGKMGFYKAFVSSLLEIESH